MELIINQKINKMETLQFKTNINCGGCIAKVTPFLNEEQGIIEWKVDTNNPNKILTVQKEGITENEIIATVKEAGFKIEPISIGF
jgi:copper chaperone